MRLGRPHGVVLVVQHLEHVGDVAVLVGRAHLGLHTVLPGPGVVRVGRRRPSEARLTLLAAGPALLLVVVGVRPPDVELSEQVLAVLVRQALLEVLLSEVDQSLAVHVPQVEVQQGHGDIVLLGREDQPRSELVAGPVRGIW